MLLKMESLVGNYIFFIVVLMSCEGLFNSNNVSGCCIIYV